VTACTVQRAMVHRAEGEGQCAIGERAQCTGCEREKCEAPWPQISWHPAMAPKRAPVTRTMKSIHAAHMLLSAASRSAVWIWAGGAGRAKSGGDSKAPCNRSRSEDGQAHVPEITGNRRRACGSSGSCTWEGIRNS